MLCRLGDGLLGQGLGWHITAGGGRYQVMPYDYHHSPHRYAMGERFDMTFTERYTSFPPDQAMDIHLQVNDVEAREYLG